MKIITEPVDRQSIFTNSTVLDNQFIKAVVDINRQVIAYDAGMHVDLEQLLLEQGSRQQDIWGINLLKGVSGDEWIEFDSMINIRPGQNNRSRGVENENIRNKIIEIVNQLFKPDA